MADLMRGKRGLIMGVANERSIAWGIARAMAAEGAELAFTYQGEAFGKRVQPLVETIGADIMIDCDVMNEAKMDAAFAELGDRWGTLDFVVHAIAYSDRAELTGRFIDTSLMNFTNSMAISCYSLIDVARRSRGSPALLPPRSRTKNLASANLPPGSRCRLRTSKKSPRDGAWRPAGAMKTLFSSTVTGSPGRSSPSSGPRSSASSAWMYPPSG